MTPQTTYYLRRSDIADRLRLHTRTFLRLRKHPDPSVRFPAPTMILNHVPLWSIEVVEEYERLQQELSKDRTTVGPEF